MSRQIEIAIAGVGGQGLILCGTLLAEAAVLHDGKRATLSSEYGVETRGTFAKSDVIVSGEEIYFPDVTDADLVICLAQAAYQRYSGRFPRALLIYNADEVTADPAQAEHERGIPITHMAKELGNPATANILTLGIITGVTGAVSAEGAQDAIGRFFEKKSEKVVGMNRAAFEKGYELGRALGWS